MRTSRRIVFALVLGAATAGQVLAFDGAPAPQDVAIPVVSAQPGAAVALKKARPSQDTSLTALQYAAEGGHPIAQWKLGRMYADGDGVAQDVLHSGLPVVLDGEGVDAVERGLHLRAVGKHRRHPAFVGGVADVRHHHLGDRHS